MRGLELPFEHRLAIVQTLRSMPQSPPPTWLEDQLQAATVDAGGLFVAFAAAAGWGDPWTSDGDVEAMNRIAAAVIGCDPCLHLRRGGVAPAIVRLPHRRVDCRRCAATFRRAPVDEGDRCDWCGTRGVVFFTPFVAHFGPAIVAGDACSDCLAVFQARVAS